MNTETGFRIAFWVLVAGLAVMRLTFSLLARRAGGRRLPGETAIQREGKFVYAMRFVLFFLLIAWLVIYAVNPPWIQFLALPFPAWLRWVGAGIGFASLAFWTWVQVILGKHWTPHLQLRQEHLLVTSGPYARIRHPLYSAMMGYVAGIALLGATWFFILMWIVMAAGVIDRVPKEEQMMIAEFGDEYREYMGNTWRFLPKPK